MKANQTKLLLLLFCCIVFSKLQAQEKENSLDNFIGKWNGTSICQVKNSPCHDEVVVYHISKGNSPDSCVIQANKIVKGVEEDMGSLPCVYNSKTNELSSTAYGLWNFKLVNGKIEGTLIHKGNLYRIISLMRSNN
jgi:hypothetical protein